MTEEKITFEVPVIQWKNNIPTFNNEHIKQLVDAEGCLDLVVEFRKMQPGISLIGVLNQHFRDVCPKSLVDMRDMQYLAMEAFCSEYGGLPHSGGMMEQPNIIVEMFNIIRGTRNEFENTKQKELKKKLEVQTKK